MTTAHQSTRYRLPLQRLAIAGAPARRLASRPCTRARRPLSPAGAAAVLSRARFEIHQIPGDVLLAHRELPGGEHVTVILTPNHAHQYVILNLRDGGKPLPAIVEIGCMVAGAWRWHDEASAVRRALTEVHLRRAGGVR